MQIPHITLLQAFSLMPWILLTTVRFAEHPSKWWGILLAVFISQQIFAGFPQATFITLLCAAVFTVYNSPSKLHLLSTFFRFSLVGILGLGLSMAQLLPSYEFLQQTGAAGGFSGQTSTYFSLPPLHLVSLIAPYTFGNPRMGTYPPFNEFDGSIFWENTAYIGYLPLALLLFLLKERQRLSVKQKKYLRIVAYLLIGAAFLMFGSHSPFYFIFSIWPFNLFRAPSRFLWVFLFALVTVSMGGAHIFLEYTKRFRAVTWITAIVLFLNLGLMWWYWWGYHPYESANAWIAAPESAMHVKNQEVTYSLGIGSLHNKFFLKTGWTSMEPYRWLRNSLDPSSTTLWGITTNSVYAGRFLHRQSVLDSLFQEEIRMNTTDATISATGKKMLDTYSIGTIISALPIKTTLLPGPKQLTFADSYTLDVFENPTALPRAYIATQTALANTAEDAKEVFASQAFIPGQTVILEKALTLSGSGSAGLVEQVQDQPLRKQFTITNNYREGMLIVDQTYYPGWEAKIDGINAEIIPANIRQQGIIIPPGDHEVAVAYRPRMFYIGALISLILHCAIGVVVLFGFLSWRHRTAKNIPAP